MKSALIPVLFVCCALAAAGQQPTADTTADEVIAKVFAHDRERERLSQGYFGRRLYVFDNGKFNKHAELLVSVKADPDGTKYFEVLEEQGWTPANRRVLREMLESEAETSRPTVRPKTLLDADNYSFSLLQTEIVDGNPTYIIAVVPKRPDKYLFEGRIWVDGSEYAVVRCEGKPARNPSFWTRSVHFVHEYQKSGAFWFPSLTQSDSEARLFGKTDVVIHYFDYTANTTPVREASTRHHHSNLVIEKANYVSTR